MSGKGSYQRVPSSMFRPMTKPAKNRAVDETYQPVFRCKVLGESQLHLPARLVREVGYKSPQWVQNARVAWHYHEGDNKAVLASKNIERASLELLGVSAISDVSNEDLDSQDASGGRVTIIKKLPDSLYERLTQDRLVLRPQYADHHDELTDTSISVYPGGEYDRGELPNVDHVRIKTDSDETGSNGQSAVIGTSESFADMF